MKKLIAALSALLAFITISWITILIVGFGAAVILTWLDIHISENDRALNNVEAAANILGLIIGVITASKTYKIITGTNKKF